ncbi:MAG TPA: class I SAM-dependent methyltransferase [Vicinamibacterales bacterium]|nr:class I SAM-dependent methyltransferase [Vicinamibacterales bacterium]
MVSSAAELKDRVRRFWDNQPCGVRHGQAEPGTREFYRTVEAHRYLQEFHIPEIAEFAEHTNERVLEIGGGLGTDGRQFARHGARYIDADLSRNSLTLAREGFRLERLPGGFTEADAENLPFLSESFDVVYSHGVLHHTPDTQRAINEVHRLLKPGGKAIVMLYARESLGYAAAHVLGRARLAALRRRMGRGKFNEFVGLPADHRGWIPTQIAVNNSTDGLGNPLSRFYTAGELHAMFGRFSRVTLAKHYFPRHKLPVIGPRLPRRAAAWLGRTAGSYWYIKAVK